MIFLYLLVGIACIGVPAYFLGLHDAPRRVDGNHARMARWIDKQINHGMLLEADTDTGSELLEAYYKSIPRI